MILAPIFIPIMLLVGLLSLVVFFGGLYLVWAYVVGVLVGTAVLVGGIALIAFSLLGRYLALLLLGRPGHGEEPHFIHSDEVRRIKGVDGTELHVECWGPRDAQPIILTHGIAADNSNWYYAKRHLVDRYRLITWDIRGLGLSDKAVGNDYSLEKMAGDLEKVLQLVDKPAIIAGHSMGGMTTLTFCRLYPHLLGKKVIGIGLVNTTYTNPVRSSMARNFVTAIHKPILTPLLYVIIGLYPLVWLQSFMSYMNGMSHVMSRIGSFSGHETRGQLDFMTWNNTIFSPAVLARQMLAMFKYDASAILPAINVPTLIVAANTDRGCIPEASEFMHSQIPGSELVTLAPSGHVSILERNQDFTDALDRWVQKVVAPVSSSKAPLPPYPTTTITTSGY